MKKIIFIYSIVGIGIGIGLYGLWIIKQPEPKLTGQVKCVFGDETIPVKTIQVCEEIKKVKEEIREEMKKEREMQKMMTEKAKILNCRWDYGLQGCYSYFGEKKYIWLDDEWKETEASKICSLYADKRVSDLPVKCLDYFGLKK